ncbi:MAG: hypothetical protein H7258_14785 [Ferruginibacter sp.]|nr:hypothetical protein [Ferruginibacter sp.]
MNYFELFGIPSAPTVDRSSLAKRYFELQRENHPDFFTQATMEEKDEALKQSADINKAFKIFQDREMTLEYFLLSVAILEQEEKYNLPQDFLMEMMEINESLADEGDSITREKLTEYLDSLLADVTPVLDNYNKETTSQTDLLRLKDYHYKKKYLNRILDRLGD